MTSNTTEAEDSLPFSIAATATIGFFIVLLSLFTVVGNTIVFYAFVKNKTIRNYSDFLVLNLAISDFIIGFICIPFYAPYVLLGKWPFGHTFCIIWLIVDYITPAASALNMCVISLDRYMQVGHPLWARHHRTSELLAVLLALPWVIPAVYFIPGISLWEITHGRLMPSDQCFLPYKRNITMLMTGILIEFLIPFVTVTVLNLLVYLSIRKRSKTFWNTVRGQLSTVAKAKEPNTRPTTDSNNASSASSTGPCAQIPSGSNSSSQATSTFRKDKKAARSLFILVLVFGLCWIPYEVTVTVQTLCNWCVNMVVFEFVFWVLWINSTINPILYPFLHTRYRRAYQGIFKRKTNRILPTGNANNAHF